MEVSSERDAESYFPDIRRGGRGFPVLLVALYIAFEFGRPSNPLHIPMVISALLLLGWIFQPHKKWNVQIKCLLIFLGVMLIDVPLAANNYWAFWTTYGMAVILLCVAIPLIHIVDSLPKIALLVNTWMVASLYVGVWAIFHHGFGPAGTDGQDENYVGAMMTMALPFAFFSLFLQKGLVRRTLLGLFCGLYLLSIVTGMSRGAFVGLCFVLLYCLTQSPKKWVGWMVGCGLVIALSLFATEKYWQDMSTITDTQESTVDYRIELWQIATRMFLNNPITGVGPGNFVRLTGEYQSADQWQKFGRNLSGNQVAHSLYFELIAELGLAGAITFLIILYSNYKDMKLIKQVVQRARDRIVQGTVVLSDEQKASFLADLGRADSYRKALTASLIGCLVTSAFLSTLYFSYFWFLTAMIVALREICVKTGVENLNYGFEIGGKTQRACSRLESGAQRSS